MRKIEQAMRLAVDARENWYEGNTVVNVSDGGNWLEVVLHGNTIYKSCEESGRAWYTLAGWNSNVTKSRLRALGIDVRTKDGKIYVNNKEINKYDWYERERV